MRFFEDIFHFFVPSPTNGHRARGLHLSSLSLYLVVLLVFQVGILFVSRFSPGVLGYASNITVEDLLKYTNEKREAAGVGTVVLNEQLVSASSMKADDMFKNQYWAHISPSGKDPWSFIISAGYNYLFAGENLARDFGDSKSVVEAWMKSPSHRDNLLNPRYQEIGFAVVNGKYAGYETTLVVQMFGTKPTGAPTIDVTKPKVVTLPSGANPKISANILPGSVEGTFALNLPKIDIYRLMRWISLGSIMFLLGLLVIDAIVVWHKKVVRLSGHNFSHVLILLVALIAVSLIGRGIIL